MFQSQTIKKRKESETRIRLSHSDRKSEVKNREEIYRRKIHRSQSVEHQKKRKISRKGDTDSEIVGDLVRMSFPLSDPVILQPYSCCSGATTPANLLVLAFSPTTPCLIRMYQFEFLHPQEDKKYGNKLTRDAKRIWLQVVAGEEDTGWGFGESCKVVFPN